VKRFKNASFLEEKWILSVNKKDRFSFLSINSFLTLSNFLWLNFWLSLFGCLLLSSCLLSFGELNSISNLLLGSSSGGLYLSTFYFAFLWLLVMMVKSFSFLDELGKNLIVFSLVFFSLSESLLLQVLFDLLSSDSLFSDQSLDLWWLVEGLVTLFDFSSDDVLSYIILLSESKYLSDIVGSLGS